MFPKLLKLYKFGFLTVLFISVFFVAPTSNANAASGLVIRSVDLMKLTKDTLYDKPTDAQIENIVATIVDTIHPTHLAISVPLDDSSDFSQKWADTIHRHGAKVIFRGTWEGMEGIYNVAKQVGINRFPAGNLQSAPADGNTTWLGKSYKYIIDRPGLFSDGDIWAILPERTEGIFQNNTSFLSYEAPGIQANYVSFFNDLKKVSDSAFAKIQKNVGTGLTTNNYSEAANGWLWQSFFDNAGMTVVDHYGITHTPQEMDADIRKIYALHGKPVFLQEWGDYWNSSLSVQDRTAYLQSMYGVFQKLVDDRILIGFNYWGAWWGGIGEGILDNPGNNQYKINDRGLILAKFFAANAPITPSVTSVVVPDPPPLPPAPPPLPPAPAPSPAPTPSTTPTSQSKDLSVNFAVPQNSTEPPRLTASPPRVYPDGTLINDHGTIYAMESGVKRPFVSMEVFNGLGYGKSKVIVTDTTNIPAGPGFFTTTQRHVRSSVVLDRGTVYYLGKDTKYPFPSAEVFFSWGHNFNEVILANAADMNLVLGPVVTLNRP